MKELKIEMWEIESVIPYELNAKIHNVTQVEKIATSIKEFGWDQPIVVDAEGIVIKGHGRRLAAISLGYKMVPVLCRSDLTEEQVRAARLADNRVALGDIDSELLKQEMATLDFDLSSIFDKKELDFMVADLGEVNMDAFMADIDHEVAAQAAETANKIDEKDSREVKIDKALGFKTVMGKDERYVARFMAQIEADTNKVGAEAFVEFVRSIMEAPAVSQ